MISPLVHDLALLLLQAVTAHEVAIVPPAEEAGLLALPAARRGNAGRRRFGSSFVLGLLAEREPDPVEQPRVESGEHVCLVLLEIAGARQEGAAAVLDDPRVVAGRKARCPGALGEREQLGEAKAAVAANARVRGLAPRITADERSHDRPAKLIAEVECHMRKAAGVAGLARGDHGLRGAARALGIGSDRVDPEPQRDADRVRPRV